MSHISVQWITKHDLLLQVGCLLDLYLLSDSDCQKVLQNITV